jgi:CHAT domain-containing protein
MLPELCGRPGGVAPSAAAWLAARARHATSPRPETVTSAGPGTATSAEVGAAERRPLLVAGPDLRYADAELDAIAACHPTGRVLRGAEATVAATLAAFETAPVAHLAGHGHHEPENVLFSRLDLADGPLMAYDVQHLSAVPALITLSACDVGRAVVKPGDELLGFTAALLYAGGGSIIASVARVANDTAARLMVAFHRAAVNGRPPGEALAIAAAGEPVTPFVCFGAG